MDVFKGSYRMEETTATTMTIRNTFIDMHEEHVSAKRRNKSLPPSFKASPFEVASEGSVCSGSEFKTTLTVSTGTDDSDGSTDVRTEASDDELATSEMGYASSGHIPTCEPCSGFGNYGMDFAYSGPWSPAIGVAEFTDFTPLAGGQSPCFFQAASCDMPPPAKLSSKAIAYQPRGLLTPEAAGRRKNILDMLESVRTVLEDGHSIKNVDVFEHDGNWSLALTPHKKNRMNIDQLLTFAQEALLKVAEQSRNVYVLGYDARETAFTSQPQGKMCRLGVMESTQYACWRYFQKGVCHYGSDCCKEHAVLEVQLETRVEMSKYDAPKPTVQKFKHEVADFLLAVTSMLAGCAGFAGAEAFHEDHACCVELLINDEDMYQKEHLSSMAKQIIKDMAQRSSVWIIGSKGEHFMAKSKGFFFALGDMPDEDTACWDLYKHCNCWRESSCRWKHPQCLVPVNVVIKSATTS
jgi:hypothetical protein